MATSNVNINIAAQFKGQKAFNDAGKAVTGLEKAAGKLGKQLASIFAAQKLLAFSRDSIKAFAEDQKAAAALANTLKNLGLGLSIQDSEKFIATMQRQTGVLDDVLRPAYAQLIQVTGSMAETQRSLMLAWNISSATGTDYQTVIDALSQAYVGNTKSLKQLNIGLTNAELKTKTYAELVDILNKKFSGAGAAALDTYQGKLDLLNVAIQNSKEIIGQGFLDAFATIAGDQNFQDVISNIENMATNVADTIRGIGVAIDEINNRIPQWLKDFLSKGLKDSPVGLVLGWLGRKGAKERAAVEGAQAEGAHFQDVAAKTAAQKKVETDAAKRAKELAALIKKQTAAQAELLKKKKEAAALDALSAKYKQAETIFNMEQIELVAAALNKQTAEDYARIKLKQDLITLQDAIQAGDLEAAQAAAKIVEEDYKQVQAYQALNILTGLATGNITNMQAALKLMPTNLNLINLSNLQSAIDMLTQMLTKLSQVPTTTTPQAAGAALLTMDNKPASVTNDAWKKVIADLGNAAAEEVVKTSVPVTDPNILANIAAIGGLPNITSTAYNPQAVTIKIENNTGGLADVIMDTTQQQSANGVSSRIIRNTGNLNW